jgi:hypothetical protein
MIHGIKDGIIVVTYETSDPIRTEPTERFAYYIAYHDSANKLRMTEEYKGFFGHDDALADAMHWIDRLDMTPEVETPKPARITVPYHVHICKQSCGIHRCVNPKCEVKGEFTPRRVAEIICAVCGDQTGTSDFFERQRMKITEFKELVIEQAIAA